MNRSTRAHPVALAVAHAARDLGLQVEGQAVLGAAGEVVKVAAHRPQEAARAQEAHQRLAGEQALADQLARIVARRGGSGAIHSSVCRSRRPPLPSLMLGSSMKRESPMRWWRWSRSASLASAKAAARARRRCRARSSCCSCANSAGRAPEQPRFEQRRPDGQIALGELDGLAHRADRLADLQAQIPQLVEQELRDLLDVRRALVGAEEQEVDVGARRQLLAAVAADRDHRQLLARGRVGAAVERAHGRSRACPGPDASICRLSSRCTTSALPPASK